MSQPSRRSGPDLRQPSGRSFECSLDPNYFRARMWLGCAYEQRGLYERVLAEYETARALDQSPYVLEWLARLFAVSGNMAATNKVLDELTRLSFSVYVDSYYLASVYAALRNRRRSLCLKGHARNALAGSADFE
jgi:tetratricopeptide (TPR) repeat protein